MGTQSNNETEAIKSFNLYNRVGVYPLIRQKYNPFFKMLFKNFTFNDLKTVTFDFARCNESKVTVMSYSVFSKYYIVC